MASKIVEFIFEIKEEISDKLYLDLMNLLKKDFHQAKNVLDEQYEEDLPSLYCDIGISIENWELLKVKAFDNGGLLFDYEFKKIINSIVYEHRTDVMYCVEFPDVLTQSDWDKLHNLTRGSYFYTECPNFGIGRKIMVWLSPTYIDYLRMPGLSDID